MEDPISKKNQNPLVFLVLLFFYKYDSMLERQI